MWRWAVLVAFALLIAAPAFAEEAPPEPDNLLALVQENPVPAPKPDTRWKRWEIAYQVASVADGVVTQICLDRGTCHETNPVLGRNPSPGKLWGIKVAGGVAHYLLVREVAKTDPEFARLLAIGSFTVQAGVVGWNLQFVF